MPYIPGSPISAYCSRCKTDTNHVVLEVEGLQVRMVRCGSCGQEGEFRVSRAKMRAGLQEAIRRKSNAPPPRRKTSRRKTETPEDIFHKLVGGRNLAAAEPYNAKAALQVADLVDHPKFGVGVVTAIADVHKAKIQFEDGERIMVCNLR